MNERVTIPTAIIHPKSIVIYNRYEDGTSRQREKQFVCFDAQGQPVWNSFINSSRKALGAVSPQAKRKITKAIEYLVTTATDKIGHEKLTGKTVKFKVAFVTLTLPSKQQHSDKEIISQCLNQFIIEIKKYHGVKNYVWRAEKQKNGNIHFHVLVDAFIPWWLLRNQWNRIINKLGYVDRFQEKHGHKTPNSTDIHSTKKIRNIYSYLTKYLTKDDNIQKENTGKVDNSHLENQTKNQTYSDQTGRVWGCNQELSKARGLALDIDWQTADELEKVCKNTRARIYDGEYFKVIYIDYHKLLTNGGQSIFEAFSNYLIERFNFHEQLTFSA